MMANAFVEHCVELVSPSESQLCNPEVRAMEADRIDSIFLNFWVKAHFPITLDPYPGVSLLLSPPLSHRGTRLQALPHF
ncbi:hypothetical protein Y032_0089g2288 [Ancylostoma ceylanicum]|uniref:Uncharacterized protein n=1 Tax=Ancylostoma ceylanicum TaxID=53326 RepID=A0A016TNC8_9BILA|nr:hypothetical protein Y032_0089g2288 [Ancylostoma ceylanicum]